MNYYINEYSLRGQFKDTDEFFASLRNHTLPVMRKIGEKKENVIWKKDTLWQAEICNGISLMGIPQKKNERSGEFAAFRIQLTKLAYQPPFWTEDEGNFEVVQYEFDEEYRKHFAAVNCFTKALEDEGRIISFLHDAYKIPSLTFVIQKGDVCTTCTLDNIYDSAWWRNEPEIKTWRIEGGYLIEVRAKEFDYHPPHFHVSKNEYAAVFHLNDGRVYKTGGKEWPPKMLSEIDQWYKEHREELIEAWNNLHSFSIVKEHDKGCQDDNAVTQKA